MKRRIYTGTSVIGGCLDPEFEAASKRLMEAFRHGVMRLVVSDLTLLELKAAPTAVRVVLDNIPKARQEYVEMTDEAAILAEHYIGSGVIGPANTTDAQHIAIATVSRVSVLLSWNFKHIVNLNRIQAYNSVNMREGYPLLEIRTPMDVIDYDDE